LKLVEFTRYSVTPAKMSGCSQVTFIDVEETGTPRTNLGGSSGTKEIK